MESTHEPADPIAKGTFATARQCFADLFRWRQRIEIVNADGETRTEWAKPTPLKNPISVLALLSAKDWTFFLVGFLAWTADAFDFHSLSIQQIKLAHFYHKSKTDISTAITLTLLLRSVGAAVFGFAGDRWGRKWPMVLNMVILGVLQIATIYASTYGAFLGVRALFGLFMDGVYGNAIAMALENSPIEARGIMSGILQQGYSFGYVLAACVNLGVGGSDDSWKVVFWIGAGFSIAVGVIRAFFPESQQFIDARKMEKEQPDVASHFWSETWKMLRQEWRLAIYCCILMTWFNFYSHTSQDNYTTFMIVQKGLDNSQASRASILMKTGACIGGPILGYTSQWLGRRRAICIAAIVSGCLIPAWILPTTEGALSASGFLMQFFVQGAWGVMPIHLNELSPPAYRSSFAGITYQIGNMISSPSAQIVNAVAEHSYLRNHLGQIVQAYGPTMGIATAIIASGIAVCIALGPEKRGRQFDHETLPGLNAGHELKAKQLDLEGGTEQKHIGTAEAIRHVEKPRTVE